MSQQSPPEPYPTAAQIGRSGELLVQYRLLRQGIDSAPLTVDTGIDLVAYAPGRRDAVTLQVKANAKPKPGGGKGPLALDWWIPVNSPAQLVACVDLQSENVWIFRHEELATIVRQQSGDRYHLYFYTGPSASRSRASRSSDFACYRLDARIDELFLRHSAAPGGGPDERK